MTSLRWRIKKAVWTRWQVLRFKLAKERPVAQPTPTKRVIGLVAMSDVHPDVPLTSVLTFDQMPKAEADLPLKVATRVTLGLARRVSLELDGAPSIDDDATVALDTAYTKAYRSKFPMPKRPTAFDGDSPDLGELALSSPYGFFLARDPESGDLVWDFRFLGEFEHHDGLCSLGLIVRFEIHLDQGLRAVEIDSTEYGTVRPHDARWADASRLAVCAATTHLSMGRHFNYVHLIAANHWDVIGRNHLDVDHPIFRLVWPHLTNGMYTNYGITRSQLRADGDFTHMFSFTHDGLMAYFDATYEAFDITITDPNTDWNRRGLVGASLAAASQLNMQEIFQLFYDHALRWISNYYPSDAALGEDEAVVSWVEALDRSIPNGVYALAGSPLNRDGLARLIASFMSEGIAIHDLAGTTLWNYQLWSDHNPTRVYQDGRRVPVDVYQRVVNNNFGLQLRRAQLLDDYSYLALDDAGKELFVRFRDDCQALQDRYDREPGGLWRLEPDKLEINMNG